MTDLIAAQAVLDEAGCLNCFTPYQLQLIQTQLLMGILAGGGGGTGSSCLTCSDVDPVAAPTCDCAMHINRATGSLFYWDANLSIWIKLVGS
jgi:hypothetical protein